MTRDWGSCWTVHLSLLYRICHLLAWCLDSVYCLGSGTLDTVWLGPVFYVHGRLQLSCSGTLCLAWLAVICLRLVRAVVAFASHLILTDAGLPDSTYNMPPVAFVHGSYPTGEYLSCRFLPLYVTLFYDIAHSAVLANVGTRAQLSMQVTVILEMFF